MKENDNNDKRYNHPRILRANDENMKEVNENGQNDCSLAAWKIGELHL